MQFKFLDNIVLYDITTDSIAYIWMNYVFHYKAKLHGYILFTEI